MSRLCIIVCRYDVVCICRSVCFFFFQAEDGIRDLVRSRGLGDVYKRQRIEENDFDIEQDKEHRHQVVLDRKTTSGIMEGDLSLIHI